MSAFVYILKGKRFYVGSTNDLERRLKQHKTGHTHTTKRIGDFELIKTYQFESLKEARSFERTIKKSGHIERYI